MPAPIMKKDVPPDDLTRLHEAALRFFDCIGRVVVGKREAVELFFTALLCEGHILLEDVPGVGKTLLAKAAARALACEFKRIQFTPDLLPSDVTGINYFNPKSGDFQFIPGPIMANIVLADEINRATPRTQSCLLEAMQERQITVDAESKRLPRPFVVLATQNPIEQEGTFPLPEAQLDRFLMKLNLGYPSEEEEGMIVSQLDPANTLEALDPVLDGAELMEYRVICGNTMVEDSVRGYLIRLVRGTRDHRFIQLGASPRAAQALFRAAQARAALDGRSFVLPDDVKNLALPVLAHRLVIRPECRVRGRTKESIVTEIIEQTPVPID